MPVFNTAVDLKKNSLKQAVIDPLASAPSTPTDGQVYYDSTVPGLRVRVSGAWVTLGAGAATATTGALGTVQLAGDLAGTGTTGAAPLIGQASQLINGSAGTPAVRFNASPSSGLYSSTTNHVSLSANSTQVFDSTSTTTTLPLAVVSSLGITITTGGLIVSAGGVSVTGNSTVAGSFATTGGSGTITSAQAVTVSAGGITVTGNSSITGTLNMNSNQINGLANGTASGDAVNLGQVQALIQGLDVHGSVRAATVGTETYTVVSGSVTVINGTTLDGVSPGIGDRILIKDAPAASGVGSVNSTQPGNGIYTVTNATTNLTVARAADVSGTNSPIGDFTFVEAGTANLSSGWVVGTPTTGAFTYGTNNIQWTQFSGAGEIIAGTGISKNGNTISIENSGVLLPAHGGSGVASPTAHGVLVAAGASAFVPVAPSATSGLALVSGGSAADPSFAALNLTAAGSVTNALPLANGGTAATTAVAARTSLAAAAVDTSTLASGSSSYTFTPAPAPKTAGAWVTALINQSTGAKEEADIVVNSALNTPLTGPVNQITVTFGAATAVNYTLIAVG